MTEQAGSHTDEIEDLDSLLSESDPEFMGSLGDIQPKEGEDFSNLSIESSLTDHESMTGEIDPTFQSQWAEKWPRLYRLFTIFDRALDRLWSLVLGLWIKVRYLKMVFKTRPKEFLSYLKVMSPALVSQMKKPIGVFRSWPRAKKITGILFFSLVLATALMAQRNIRGIWFPGLGGVPVTGLADSGILVSKIDPSASPVDLFLVFPEARYTVLFAKVIVNLSRRPGWNENPMGAFEFFLSLDTREGAVEVQRRERELLDRVQRAVEALTYPEINGPGGVDLLRDSVQSELNQTLTHGRVMDVHINTMVIKP